MLGVIVFLIVLTIAGFFGSIFSCKPVAKRWTPNMKGSCIYLPHLAVTSCVLNIITDFLILILPMRPVWQLQLATKQKLMILGIFATGSL